MRCRTGGLQLFRFPPPVLHEAISTGDPELVHTILQHRDFHQTSTTLGGVPELLQKISEVHGGGGGGGGGRVRMAPEGPVELRSSALLCFESRLL